MSGLDRSGGGFRATHDQPARLDCGRCNAPAPYYFYKDGKLGCRGAGDSHLPQSLRARSPHVLSHRRRFHRLRTRNEVPRADGTTHHHRDSAGALELDTSSSRHGADWTAPAGDFVLRTTSLRGWTAANAEHLHHTIFIKTANLVAGMFLFLQSAGVRRKNRQKEKDQIQSYSSCPSYSGALSEASHC